jgi:hypothetical protein
MFRRVQWRHQASSNEGKKICTKALALTLTAFAMRLSSDGETKLFK